MPRTPTPVPMSEATANDFRKILAFASSALEPMGPRLSERDALEVIRSICRERLGTGNARAEAIVRHAERLLELEASRG